jgi:hypothetical protein
MFAIVVIGFVAAFGLVLANHRKPAIILAVVLQVFCVLFYFTHSYHVTWPW